ncbi:MAG: hypothetical protein IJO42_02050 [Clostridia bacterium]|nr:hypothetical protein [Clostridia bacterium]
MLILNLPFVAAVKMTVNWLYLAIGLVAVMALIALVAVFIPWLHDFRHELKYLNIEIGRSEGREQKHWIKRRRRLWLSILPFFHYHGH